MNYNRPITLTIAGFDPCGGAGVLADIKTMEQHQCLGMAVNTSITNQTENNFVSVKWFSVKEIISHIETLMNAYKFEVVKIGIVENLEFLNEIVTYLKFKHKNIKIVWDTVLSATTGFNFINELNKKKLQTILQHIFLITPNTNEAKKLSGIDDEKEAAQYLSQFCNVLLKGGHSKENEGIDFLYLHEEKKEYMLGINKPPHLTGNPPKQGKYNIVEKQTLFQMSVSEISPKHGSGCILSSAIACNLAKGEDLYTSCVNAKKYIETILSSNPNLLAYHVA